MLLTVLIPDARSMKMAVDNLPVNALILHADDFKELC